MILLKKIQLCHHHCLFLPKDLSDDVDSTGVSVALPELYTTAYDWKTVKIDYEVSQFLFHDGPVEEHFIDCNSPCNFFLKVFDEKIRENIVFQTNLNIQQKQKRKSILPVKERGFYGFIGVNLLMGYHKLPSWLNYWKCDPDLSVPSVSSVMSRIRFVQILWNLHVNDSSTIPAEKKNKLYKFEKNLITSLKENFDKLYDASRYLSVDVIRGTKLHKAI